MLLSIHLGVGRGLCTDDEALCYKNLIGKVLQSFGRDVGCMEMASGALSIMEEDPLTNCGYGSNLNICGEVECDASMMTSDGYFGSVSCLRNCIYPSRVARSLTEEQMQCNTWLVPPMMLSGEGAYEYAKTRGLLDPQEDPRSERALTIYKMALDVCPRSETPLEGARMDTVGVIAIDKHKNVAVGCSSGGILLKNKGRVGHSAIYGAGCWSEVYKLCERNITVTCCTSGVGEFLISRMMSKSVCDLVHDLYAKDQDLNIEDMLNRFMENYKGNIISV